MITIETNLTGNLARWTLAAVALGAALLAAVATRAPGPTAAAAAVNAPAGVPTRIVYLDGAAEHVAFLNEIEESLLTSR